MTPKSEETMLQHLQGIVDSIENQYVVLDVGGLGFALLCSRSVLARAQRGGNLRLYTSLSVAEGGILSLFGFSTLEERKLFEMLTSVKGIGGKMAMGLLGTLEMETILHAILSGSPVLLASAPGIGRKTAERICFELQEKIKKTPLLSQTIVVPELSGQSTVAAAVLQALESLGFSLAESREGLQEALKKTVPPDSEEQLLQAALQSLTRRR